LFNFVLKHTIRKIQSNQEGLKLHGTLQILANADNANLLGESKPTFRKAHTFLVSSKKTGIDVIAEKI
jgi:predicted nucleic acid-binding protein